jgi:hypothetical protein
MIVQTYCGPAVGSNDWNGIEVTATGFGSSIQGRAELTVFFHRKSPRDISWVGV